VVYSRSGVINTALCAKPRMVEKSRHELLILFGCDLLIIGD